MQHERRTRGRFCVWVLSAYPPDGGTQTRAQMHSFKIRIIESFRWEKTLYIVKSNHQSSVDQLLAILELLTSIPQASHGEILGVLQGGAAPSLQV